MSPSPRLTLVFAALLLSALAAAQTQTAIPTQHNEATIAQQQADMASGKLTSEGLTQEYISRILALEPPAAAVAELLSGRILGAAVGTRRRASQRCAAFAAESRRLRVLVVTAGGTGHLGGSPEEGLRR